MVAILGVLLGSQFNEKIFDNISDWYIGLVGVIASSGLMIILCTYFYRKVGRYDKASAYFSSIPGGLSEMMVLGESMGGDPRKISLSHGVRILTAVFLIAFYFRIFEGYQSTGVVGQTAANLSFIEWLILILSGLLGWKCALLLKIPAAQLVGPLLLSAALHVSGLVSAMPPTEIVAAAQVALGAAIGARFVGIRFKEVRHIIVVSICAALIMVTIAGGFAILLGQLFDSSETALFLALAPGGLAEMSIIALSFGAAAAYVSTHHILRILILVVIAPTIYNHFVNRSRIRHK